MVAVDESGEKTPIPNWEPVTKSDKKQHESAIKLMEMRKQLGEEMQIFVK